MSAAYRRRRMSTESIGAEGRPGVDWGRAEFILTGLAFLGFLALPIRLTTVYGGLPGTPCSCTCR